MQFARRYCSMVFISRIFFCAIVLVVGRIEINIGAYKNLEFPHKYLMAKNRILKILRRPPTVRSFPNCIFPHSHVGIDHVVFREGIAVLDFRWSGDERREAKGILEVILNLIVVFGILLLDLRIAHWNDCQKKCLSRLKNSKQKITQSPASPKVHSPCARVRCGF